MVPSASVTTSAASPWPGTGRAAARPPRAVALISGGLDSMLAARLAARFSQGRDAASVRVELVAPDGRCETLEVVPLPSDEVPQEWYV